jgi:hypothetical protein
MGLKSLIDSLARNRSGVVLLTGVAAVLTGVERLMSTRRPAGHVAPKPVNRIPVKAPVVELRIHYFKVRQTRSELGYVYWVLQGFGCYKSFALFDTWQEAMAEAQRRLAATAVEDNRQPVYADR